MIQAFTSSPRLSSCLLHLQPQKGSRGILTPLQWQTRHTTQGFSRSAKKPRAYRHLFPPTHATKSDDEFVLQPRDDPKVTQQSNLGGKWDAFYRFCRIHVIKGMVIGVSSISLLPLTSVGDLSPAFCVGLLQALIPFVFLGIYVGGINQYADVEIDKINKPYYPLASGEISMGQGKAIITAFGSMCLAMGIMFQSLPLFIGILVYFLLGTAYSVKLPLLRWKTNPFLAALCIVGAHGLTVPLAVFFHIQHVLGKSLAFTKSLGFGIVFFSLFTGVLAVFKDIPDVEGDRAFGNSTFCVRHGKKNVFRLCMIILLIAYGLALVIGASSSILICKIVSVIGHCALAFFLLLRAESVNLDDDVSTESFYMLLWKMFYAEYVLIHFIR